MLDTAHCQAEGVIDLAHPLHVALGEIVVDGDDMNTAAGDGVQRDGKGGGLGFAFARSHFGDLALMQNDTAHQLNVVVALAEGTAGRFAGGRKRFGQKFVERFAFSMSFAEFDGERAKFVI